MGRRTLLLVFLQLVVFSEPARILGIIPTPSYSHQIVYQPLWEQLSRRGHEVVVLTTNPVNNPELTNLKEIDISFTYSHVAKLIETIRNTDVKLWTLFVLVNNAFIDTTKILLEHSSFQDILTNKTEHFDLVILEALYPTYGAFAHRFKSPIIGVCSFEPWPEWVSAMGNPLSASVYPHPHLPFYRNLSFMERLVATWYTYLLPPLKAYLYDDAFDNLVSEHFGEGYPKVSEFYSNLDMLFSHSNPALKLHVPTIPAIVEFGGDNHLSAPKPLPEDIKSFMDNSKNGVIYFSFGSNVPISLITKEEKTILLETLSELDYDILWKFELEDYFEVPKNVKIVKWVPQPDVLRHPKVKAFIMQGGMQSLEEALYTHIPVVIIPFWADQGKHAQVMEYKGTGIFLAREDLTKINLKSAVLKIIEDPSYKQNMKTLAGLAKDQPMDIIEKLVWWTEYVIRNNGAKHLRSVVVDVPFYQYYLLDVITFSFIAIFTILFVCYKMLMCLMYCLRIRRKEKSKQH